MGVLPGQPAEGVVVEIGLGDLRQDRPGVRPRNDQRRVGGGQVVEPDAAIGGQVLGQKVSVEALRGTGADEIEALLAVPHDGELGTHPAAPGQRVRQVDAAHGFRQSAADQPVEPGFGARSRDAELGEAGDVDDPDILANVSVLPGDVREVVGAPETPSVRAFDPGRREPVRPFPAIALAPDRTHAVEQVVDRAGLGRTRGGPFLVRVVNDEDVLIGFFVFGPDIGLVGIGAEPAGIDIHHVDRGLALDDPFRELPAGAARRRDAEAVALVQPHIAQTPCRPHQGAAVRRIGDRTVDDVLDARPLEAGHAVDRRLQMGHQPVQIAGKQVALEAVGNAVPEPGGRAFFVGTEDVALAFFPEIVGCVRLAQHRHFRQSLAVPLDQLGHLVGDDILVFHRDRRDVDPQHPAGVPAIVAGRAHHVLAADIAAGRPDQPFAFGLSFQRRDRGIAVDLRPSIASPDGHCLGDVRRSDMAVIGMVERADQPLVVAQRPKLGDFGRRDDLERHADRVGGTAILAILVHPLPIGGKPEVAGHVEAHVLAGFLRQGFVQIDRIFVELAHAVAHVEQRQKAGGMPGRPGGELGTLAQDRVGPPLPGEVIERRDADDTAADHNRPCMRLHGFLRQVGTIQAIARSSAAIVASPRGTATVRDPDLLSVRRSSAMRIWRLARRKEGL